MSFGGGIGETGWTGDETEDESLDWDEGMVIVEDRAGAVVVEAEAMMVFRLAVDLVVRFVAGNSECEMRCFEGMIMAMSWT